MALMIECPICHQKQPVAKKKCIGKTKGQLCGHDLDKAKRQKKANYWECIYIPQDQRGPEGRRYKRVCLGKNQREDEGTQGRGKAHSRHPTRGETHLAGIDRLVFEDP